MKKVLVCCANGVATSTFVKMKVSNRLNEEGIDAEVVTCTTLEVVNKSNTWQPDIIISTAGVNIGTDEKFPVVYGVSLMTGMDADETWEEILSVLRN